MVSVTRLFYVSLNRSKIEMLTVYMHISRHSTERLLEYAIPPSQRGMYRECNRVVTSAVFLFYLLRNRTQSTTVKEQIHRLQLHHTYQLAATYTNFVFIQEALVIGTTPILAPYQIAATISHTTHS